MASQAPRHRLPAPPAGLRPMQPVASRELPADQGAYAFEPKWDGYRALIHVRPGGPVRLVSRQGAEMRGWFPELTDPGGLAGRDAVLDGEVVALAADGHPSFAALQGRARRRPATTPSTALALMVFDLLWLDGRLHLTDPYTQRRELLEGLVLPDRWQLVQAFPGTDGGGSALLAATRDHGLEGVVAKRLTSPYRPGRRSRTWLKIKHYDRAPFVVGGWIPDAAGTVAALLVGCYPTGPAGHPHERLRLAARVDTGLSPADRVLLTQRLAPLASTANPFSSSPAQLASAGWEPHTSPDAIRFVRPELVVEVQSGPWDGERLRHPATSAWPPAIAPASDAHHHRSSPSDTGRPSCRCFEGRAGAASTAAHRRATTPSTAAGHGRLIPHGHGPELATSRADTGILRASIAYRGVVSAPWTTAEPVSNPGCAHPPSGLAC